MSAGLLCAAGLTPVSAQDAQSVGFQRFVEGLWPAARARGVSRGTFDEAFRGVEPDSKIVALTKKQSEFVRPIWEYINGAISNQRLDRGRKMAAEWAQNLSAVERTYGVPKEVVLGVWGMETNFGGFTGSIYVVRALSTLAYTGYRGEFFKDELLTALEILEADHIDRNKMLGSWAGAMGQTQFMPSSFMKLRSTATAMDSAISGVRFRTPSHRPLITSAERLEAGPALGLRGPAAGELRLSPPQGRVRQLGFPRRQAHGRQGASPRRRGSPVPSGRGAGTGLPGHRQLRRDQGYNSSDAYAMGVAHLGDRLVGGPAIAGAWPKDEPMLDKDQREEVQKRLASLGLYNGEADGKLGSKTRDALRNFQARRGLIPDGYADVAALRELRTAR